LQENDLEAVVEVVVSLWVWEMRGLGSLKDWIFWEREVIWKAEGSLYEEEEIALRAAEAEETVAIAEEEMNYLLVLVVKQKTCKKVE